MRLKLILAAASLLAFTGSASAQCSNCISGNGYVVVGSTSGTMTVCCSSTPDESTLAAWAAKKAVAAQLDWFDEAKVAKLSRVDLDTMRTRVDELCKWAKTLSNHIFASAYAEWGSSAVSKIEDRRRSLDQIDVAKSLVTGLPTPPEGRP